MSDRKKRTSARERRSFEDIRSTSTGDQSKPEWFDEHKRNRSDARPSSTDRPRSNARVRPNSRQRPSDDHPRSTDRSRSTTRSTRDRPQSRPARPPNRRDEPRKRRKKPMSLFKRRLLIVLALLGMAAATVFLAESLLLRVSDVRVTGDQVYSDEDILKLCGFKKGDNLLLIPASDREKKLESQMPYISKAKITRKIPGTVIIDITASRGACSIESGGSWYVVAGDGKVLETLGAPKEGLMQVLGVTVQSANVGGKLVLEGEEASEVFSELIGIIDRLGPDEQGAAQEFTRMDLTNLMDIRLWYEDRVECVLGSDSQLDYKLIQGYGILTNHDGKGLREDQRGVLDLSYLPTKKASYFTPSEGSPGEQPTVAPDGTVPEPAATPVPEGSAEPEGGRGSDIPDSLFTG